MSQKPVTMDQLKQILQLKNDGVAIREIARRTGISRNAIKRYLLRLQPPQDEPSEELTNKQLADKAYDNDALSAKTERHNALMEHFVYAEKELHKTGVTRQLLWVEYKEQYCDGFTYSRYCYHFSRFLKHTDVSMHLEYVAGDMIMIDLNSAILSYQCYNTYMYYLSF
jgi:transposase